MARRRRGGLSPDAKEGAAMIHDDIDWAALEADNQPTYTAPGPPRNVPPDLTDFFKSVLQPKQTLTMSTPIRMPDGTIAYGPGPATPATDWTPYLLLGGGLLLLMTMGGKGRR